MVSNSIIPMILVLVISFFSNFTMASPRFINDVKEQAAYDFLVPKAQDSLEIVSGPGTKAQKLRDVNDFFSSNNFAWDSFSWGVLGVLRREIAPGNKISAENQANFNEYKKLMKRYFKAMYVKHLDNYDADTFTVKNVVGEQKARYYIAEIMTTVNNKNPQGNAARIDFIVCDVEEKKLKVCNAHVDGFSLKSTFGKDHRKMYDEEAGKSFTKLVELFKADVEKVEK